MNPYFDDGDVRLYCADALEALREMPDKSVHMACTSPPFFGLRDYGTGTWEGGDEGCDHQAYFNKRNAGSQPGLGTAGNVLRDGPPPTVCKCGARRIDGQIGLEPSPDEWAARLVDVFREVRRVLRDDGTLWCEIGDMYAANRSYQVSDSKHLAHDFGDSNKTKAPPGYKPKDLIGAPDLLKNALREDGWWHRSTIIWAKPNAMPESVTDRPTTAHSYVFLLSKRPRYFYDAEALREPHSEPWRGHGEREQGRPFGEWKADAPRQSQQRRGATVERIRQYNENGKNARSVWNIPTEPNALAICRICDAFWQGGAPRIHCGKKCEACDGKGTVDGTTPRNTPKGSAREELGLRTSESLGRSPGWRKADDPADEPEWCEKCNGSGEVGQPVVQHFAAFPRELVRRMILAGTSERGVCGECGAPWVREVERELASVERENYKGAGVVGNHRGSEERPGGYYGAGAVTLGWKSDCQCNGHPGRASISEIVPATILDPFAGSGTSLLVARQLGRHAIGIELNERYCAMAKARMSQLSLLAQ